MKLEDLINREPLPQEGKKWEYSKNLSQAILSWFKEQLPKEMNSLSRKYIEIRKKEHHHCMEAIGYVNGYNQCRADILTNLTAKQGER